MIIPLNKIIVKILKATNMSLLYRWQIYKFSQSPLRKKEPLLIYQMGKVGSSTLRRSIDAIKPDVHPYHLHYMNGIDYMVELCRKKSLPLQDHILSSIFCRKLLKKAKTNGIRLNVISLVREPIAKNISQFFQNVDVSYPEFEYSKKEKVLSQDELVSVMTDFFIKNFRHDDPLVWFDDELKQFTNIDVFSNPFPYEKGFKIYENERFRILVIRLESLNECCSDAMKQFLGVEHFELLNENVSSKKKYAGVYEKMKNKIKLPESYINKMYSSKMATHFYSEDEITRFKDKWSRN